MDDKVTQTQDHFPVLMSGFMLSGVFCFVIAALFMLSSISGHGMEHPLGVLQTVFCR